LHYFLLYGFSGLWHLDQMYTAGNWFCSTIRILS